MGTCLVDTLLGLFLCGGQRHRGESQYRVCVAYGINKYRVGVACDYFDESSYIMTVF